MRRLSERELNRAVLARQCLLERAGAPIPRVLERVGGIQAQYAPSMYVGLWSRMAGFARDDLTRALERRSVVQATLMRVTIHLVSRRDHWPLALAVRAARRALWLRAQRGGPGEEEMAAAAAALRPRLVEGPIARAELEALLGKAVASGVGLWVDLVRAPPSGTWERRRADLYAGAEEWLGPPEADGDAALDHLVRRYLGAFGPASRADLASWTGLAPTALDPALARLRLRRFLGPGETVLLDLPRAPLPDPRRRRRRASCPPGTRPCWCTAGAPASCARSTGRGSSRCATRTPCRCSWSTASSPAPGATSTGRSGWSRSGGWRPPTGGRWPRRPRAWRRSTPDRTRPGRCRPEARLGSPNRAGPRDRLTARVRRADLPEEGGGSLRAKPGLTRDATGSYGPAQPRPRPRSGPRRRGATGIPANRPFRRRIAGALAAALAVGALGLGGVVLAAPSDDKARVDQELQQAQQRLGEALGKERVLTDEVSAYSQRIRRLEEQLAPLRARTRELQAELDSLRVRLDALSARLDVERRRLARAEDLLARRQLLLGARLRDIYVRGEPDPIVMLLQSESFSAAVETQDIFNRVVEKDNGLVMAVKRHADAVRETRDKIAGVRAEVAAAEARTAEATRESIDAKAELERQRSAQADARDGRRQLLERVQGHRHELERETARPAGPVGGAGVADRRRAGRHPGAERLGGHRAGVVVRAWRGRSAGRSPRPSVRAGAACTRASTWPAAAGRRSGRPRRARSS